MAPFDETSIGQSHASVGGEYALSRFYRIPENDPDFSKKKKKTFDCSDRVETKGTKKNGRLPPQKRNLHLWKEITKW